MSPAPHHAIEITEADSAGVPTFAECSCGWEWERPADDRWADTLPSAGRAHLVDVRE